MYSLHIQYADYLAYCLQVMINQDICNYAATFSDSDLNRKRRLNMLREELNRVIRSQDT